MLHTGNRKWLSRLIWTLVIVTAWTVLSRLNIFPGILFPSLAEIFRTLFTSLFDGPLMLQTGISLGIIILSCGISLIAALIIFIASVYSPAADHLFSFLHSFLHPIPGIALLPLMILWFGTGTAAVVAVIVHSVLWPLYTSLSSAYAVIPPMWHDIGNNYMLSRSRKVFHIYIPACLPGLISGLKIGWARSWRALISAEMIFGAIGTSGGIGWFLFQKRVFMDSAGLFAGLIVVAVIGLLVEDILFGMAEKKLLRQRGMSRHA